MVVSIPLPHGKCTIIDEKNYELVSKYKWSLDSKGYARTNIIVGKNKYRFQSLHRLLMGNPEGKHIDHIDGDPLNNQMSNLRICTCRQNAQNRGIKLQRYKGVKKQRNCLNRYVSRITVNGERIKLGSYDTPEEAARAYNDAASFYFGEFARLNVL